MSCPSSLVLHRRWSARVAAEARPRAPRLAPARATVLRRTSPRADVHSRESAMSVSIKRLGPGDEPILDLLAKEDADFDLEGRGGSLQPLEPARAQSYLANPAVLHWVAVEGDQIIGFLYCIHLPLRSDAGHELLLYEIGVRS